MVGETRDEMGGSEYFEYIRGFIGGRCPAVDFAGSKRNMGAVLESLRRNLPGAVHDCSKGGLAVAVSEMCMRYDTGCEVDLAGVPGGDLKTERILFSESHSRYLLAARPEKADRLADVLERRGVPHAVIGVFGGDSIRFAAEDGMVSVKVGKAREEWSGSLEGMVSHG